MSVIEKQYGAFSNTTMDMFHINKLGAFMMKAVKVGLLGFGTVGAGVVRIIEAHQEDLQSQVGSPIEIEKILVRDKHKERATMVDSTKLTEQAEEILQHPDIDVVIEVIGGIEPARTYILEALSQGKHIVTANKDLIALHGAEIFVAAKEHGCDVLFEASVGGGIPIIRTLSDSFASDRISKIIGIVNGTTNYILTKMSHESAAYEEALTEAQQLGYAEADPTSDVEGLDAARKMTILGMLAFHTNVALEDVEVKGISSITKEDIQYAKMLGYEMKLLGIAESRDQQINICVEPTLIPRTQPLATVNGVFNAVYVHGDAVGETMFYGPGAGSLPTATSVVADLVAVIKNLKLGVNGKHSITPYKAKQLQSDEQVESKNFLLLEVEDKAGVLAQITHVFANYDVSLESVIQQPKMVQDYVEVVIITHMASKASMKNVLEQLQQLDCIRSIKSIYRVEG